MRDHERKKATDFATFIIIFVIVVVVFVVLGFFSYYAHKSSANSISPSSQVAETMSE